MDNEDCGVLTKTSTFDMLVIGLVNATEKTTLEYVELKGQLNSI